MTTTLETRVDLLHLLEDLRDAYPGATEETILTEIIANALDSGAATITITTDPTAPTLTIVDDGAGMRRRELARYQPTQGPSAVIALIIDAMAADDLDRIARAYGIRLLLQFGSFVTGKVHPRSDVDLGVLLERPTLTAEEYAGLLHELQRLFPDREVDMAVLNHADPLFLRKVTESCRLLLGAPADLQRLKLYAFKRYQDHRRYLDLERRYVAKALAGPVARG